MTDSSATGGDGGFDAAVDSGDLGDADGAGLDAGEELLTGDAYLDFDDDADPDLLVRAVAGDAGVPTGLDALVDAASAAGGLEAEAARPVVAVVGRPNVGKSSLVNRILGRRAAVVEDVPGVTRDRVTYDADWNGREFIVMDTGGWETKTRGMAALVAAQAERAMNEADVAKLSVPSTIRS